MLNSKNIIETSCIVSSNQLCIFYHRTLPYNPIGQHVVIMNLDVVQFY